MSSRPPASPPVSPRVEASPPAPPPTSPARQVEAGADDSANVPWPWRLYGGLTAHLGLPIIAAWIAAAVAAVMFLPDFGAASGFGLIQLVPSNTAAVRAQATEERLFGSSLADSPALIVEHSQRSIPAATLVKIGRQAEAVDGSHPASAPPHQPSFALPLVNVPGLISASRVPATTTVTFLFFPAAALSGDIAGGADRYAAATPRPPGASVGITGPVPAQMTEGNLIENALVLLEIVTVLVIAVLVGVIFRSPVAPLVPLAGAAIAYVITRHVLGWGAHLLGIEIPSQLAPIMIALILGVVTDYSVFTLTGVRARLGAGERRAVAVRNSSSRVVPLVIAAALTVAAGTIALIGANLDFFHAVGPGMAVAVVISGLVSISFVPALVGVLGRVTFWPHLSWRPVDRSRHEVERGGGRRVVARLISRRWAAAVAAVVCVAALLAGA
jgi:putative drug exporter of the RND superfamily